MRERSERGCGCFFFFFSLAAPSMTLTVKMGLALFIMLFAPELPGTCAWVPSPSFSGLNRLEGI